MTHLHQRLAKLVDTWRGSGYACDEFPAVSEVLEWAQEPESGSLRFLRRPQLRALETYWYLRLVEKTPHVFDLYKKLYPPESDPDGLLESLGVPDGAFKAAKYQMDTLWRRTTSDDDFVRAFRLESLRETLTLDYPSYILALAMGSGKTVLIGAIIATEFALAMEYPGGGFVENALVFAPGKTIVGALRELADVPYQRILPPRLYKAFAASIKLTFTRDGEKDVPVIRRSSFNVVVTNTEKIRIQKETIRKSDLGGLFAPGREDEARSEVANLRLQAIASLPHLAVFSDEAHHTYGQSLDAELKKVRKTVDYLAAQTSLICVVNTTGTPYFQRQALKDVVIWYGLSEGIRDGILKDLAGNIQSYEFSGDARRYVSHVIDDFFRDYGDVRLPNGATAKMAIYFPQTDDLKELRPTIDKALLRVGQNPTVCLVNTSDESLTRKTDIDAFERLNDPAAPHRVILLVNKGTEGWNCPSLFACALARKLKTSNNFVLQAATRCLRQVPGNPHKARVYLSADNYTVLDRQLQETYGETIAEISHAGQETRRTPIVLRKRDIPPLHITELIRTVIRKQAASGPLRLVRPGETGNTALKKAVFTMGSQAAGGGVLRQVGDSVEVAAEPEATDAYTAAVELSARYRLDVLTLYDEMRRLFGNDEVPTAHFDDLARQIEEQTCSYEVKEERVNVALALVKPEGFVKQADPSGTGLYTAEIVYPKDREILLLRSDQVKENTASYGFHYDPYNFDSNPERSFCEQLLGLLQVDPDDVEDIYFTGALTDPSKTDFFVEYKDDKGKWRRYTPDFIIRKKPAGIGSPGSGKVLIVEIKSAQFEATLKRELREGMAVSDEGRKALALRRWENLNPDHLKYEMIFASSSVVSADQMKPVRQFLREPGA